MGGCREGREGYMTGARLLGDVLTVGRLKLSTVEVGGLIKP